MPIERIHIKGFGCIEDVELELGPLQAFIGPNDSGKSTILRAVEVAAEAMFPGVMKFGNRGAGSVAAWILSLRNNNMCSDFFGTLRCSCRRNRCAAARR